MKKIILAAGGTGGHVFPAYALAEALLEEGAHVTLLSDKRGISYTEHPEGLETLTLPMTRRKTGKVALLVMLLSLIPSTLLSCLHMLWKRPTAVIGFGGFPSAPTLVAALLLGRKIILHEQNAVLGRVNKLLLPFAKTLALSFPKTHGLPKKHAHKSVVTGNPVRKAFEDLPPYGAEKKETRTLLIIGGSQGSAKFSTLIPQALKALPKTQRQHLEIIHQCPHPLLEGTKKAYKKLSLSAITLAPFFKNIHDLMAQADLILCRSGASTVFEVSKAGRPAIFIPFPKSMDDHQVANAQAAVDLEGGWCILENEDTVQTLVPLLKKLLEDPKALASAAQNVHNLSKENVLHTFLEIL